MSDSAPKGIPGLRGTDHIGFTVPDMDEAEQFLVEVLGCEPIYTLGPKQASDDWMRVHIGVHEDTVIDEIRFYRLGHGANFEVFLYNPADGQAPQPKNSDLGGHHLAFYVDDISTAIDFLHDKDVEVMGAPTASRQAAAGQHWVYFRSPWGMQFELVSFPGGKEYERSTERVLWHPAHPEK